MLLSLILSFFHYFFSLPFSSARISEDDCCFLSFYPHLSFSLLHICFLGAYSTYLSRKLPSGRLCEQKKDILRPDGKRRAEGSPDFSVCRMCKLKMRTMSLVWNNLRFFPWMLQNIIIWLLSCFLRSYRNFLLIISLIIIWSLITCAILDKPQFKHYLHLFFVLKQVILWNVFLYWEKLRHKKTVGEIWGSHGVEYEDCCRLGYDAV